MITLLTSIRNLMITSTLMFLSFCIGAGLVLLDGGDGAQYTEAQLNQIIDEQSILLLTSIALYCETKGSFSIDIPSNTSTFFCVNAETLEGLEPTKKPPEGEFGS